MLENFLSPGIWTQHLNNHDANMVSGSVVGYPSKPESILQSLSKPLFGMKANTWACVCVCMSVCACVWEGKCVCVCVCVCERVRARKWYKVISIILGWSSNPKSTPALQIFRLQTTPLLLLMPPPPFKLYFQFYSQPPVWRSASTL